MPLDCLQRFHTPGSILVIDKNANRCKRINHKASPFITIDHMNSVVGVTHEVK